MCGPWRISRRKIQNLDSLEQPAEFRRWSFCLEGQDDGVNQAGENQNTFCTKEA